MAAVLLAVCLLGAAAGSVPQGILVLDPRPAPELELSNMNGKVFNLDESRGHWVFVHFWASWCGPCRREMPAIQRMAEHLQDTPLEIVLINTAETDDTVFTFLGIVAPALDTLMDRDGLVTERWQPRGLPATFLVDPQGRVRYQALGGRPWDKPEYREFLRQLPREPHSPSR